MKDTHVRYGHNHGELLGGLVMFVVMVVFMAGLSHWMNHKEVQKPVKDSIAVEQVVK